ncbi:hypothetical protein F6S08_24585 [Pseudomonas sp. JV449]|uniref:hypothetical protein n=1 Tax=Pseudomonas sp. JV449 TaxID=1890658 RepID=UPI0028E0BD7C|nr:hypothetical protein [Pseudomonas sp. JV449]MDT9634379.1 hypothetical protein [Pseudomonas sp. JV449]
MSSSLSVQPRPSVIDHSIASTPAQSQATPGNTLSIHSDPASTPARRSSDESQPLSPQARAQANAQNWKNLAHQLTEATKSLGEDATPAAVLSHLKTTQTVIDPHSAFHPSGMPGSESAASLESFIKHHDLPIPETRADLVHLADAANARALEPPLGDLGGGLSWPLPLTQEQRRKIRVIVESSILRSNIRTEPSLVRAELAKAALGALIKASALSDVELQDPARALDTLLKSPMAQKIGQGIQDGLNGIDTPTSISDYVLAALHIGLDRESVVLPVRNSIAGFDLSHQDYWGLPPSAIVEGLSKHLVTKGRATPATAKLATHLLLSRTAPQFLVKDIPDTLVNGSQAWVSFCLAVAKVEASAPGTASQMSYGQVMSAAQALNGPAEHAITPLLLDWGVSNGLVEKKDDALYTPEEVDSIRTAFNEQLSARIKASQSLTAEIPSRKAIALEKLKEHFGERTDFESKSLSTVSNDKAKQLDGKHSMLDMAMMGINVNWKTDDPGLPIHAINQQPRLNVNGIFLGQYESAIESLKDGIETQVKHMISELPLEDRKNLEFGKIELFQYNQYRIGRGFINPATFQSKLNELLVRTERQVDGKTEVNVYEIDVRNKRIVKRQSEAAITRGGWRDANISTKVEKFTPEHKDRLEREQPPEDPSRPPSSFTSTRTHDLAGAFFEHLGIRNQWQQARGSTTFDQQKESNERLRQFFLNLIPLRSAIVNFRDGDYEAGLLDLGLDALGLLTMGYGAAPKLAKVASSSASTAVKALQAGRVIGSSLISSLNPLSGVRGAATGGAKLATRGAKFLGDSGQVLINKVRGASGSYDLLKAANKQYGPTLIGSYKVGEQSVEGFAVLKNDQWFSYDPVRNLPYGPPIEDFSPLRGSLFDSVADMHLTSVGTNIAKARTSNALPKFNQGYRSGALDDLSDYAGERSFEALVALAAKPGRTPEEMGILARELKTRRIEDGEYFTALLASDVGNPGVSINRFAQSDYLGRVDLTSKGDCAGLSNAMALALHRGDEKIFLDNLRKASTTKSPSSLHDKFNRDIKTLQYAVNTKDTFHINAAPSLINHQSIIDDLSKSTASKYLRISTEDHAMLAGVRVKDGQKEWFFFEPNGGLVSFDNVESMREGIEKILSSGGVSATLKPKVSPAGKKEFHVSAFHPDDIVTDKVDSFAVSIMVSTPLPS